MISERVGAGKLKKNEAGAQLNLRLVRTEDVLSNLSQARRPGQTLVGFAAEHGEGAVERARGKLERKRLDAVVVNDISRGDIGFDVDDNEVTILMSGGPDQGVPFGPKSVVASAIVDAVEALRGGRAPNGLDDAASEAS